MTLISSSLRDTVVRRARNRCEYCRLSQDSQVATFPVDHVVPVSSDGPTNPENTVLACPRCNAVKWKHTEALDPQSGRLVQLFNPRSDQWSDHFRWSVEDSVIIEAISPTGRATVAMLELNSIQHLTIRSLLRRLGLHPPNDDSITSSSAS